MLAWRQALLTLVGKLLQRFQSSTNSKTTAENSSLRQWLAHKKRPTALNLDQPIFSSHYPSSSLQPPQCSAASNPVNSSPSSSTSLWSSQQHSCYGRASPSPQTLRLPSSSFFLVAWSLHFKEETCYFYGIEGKIRRLGRSWSTMSRGKIYRLSTEW